MKLSKVLLVLCTLSLGVSLTTLILIASERYQKINKVQMAEMKEVQEAKIPEKVKNNIIIIKKPNEKLIDDKEAEKGGEELKTKKAKKNIKDTNIPLDYQFYCEEIGDKYEISPYLLMAMIERESGGQHKIANDAGDTGLMQINKRWHEDRMKKLGVSDLYDAYSNILVGADFLKELFEKNDGDVYLALMKYNMNHKRAEELYRQGTISDYALKVVARAEELTELYEGR